MPEKFTQTWDDVLSSAARLQEAIPQAVVVGGTAAAIYANHRMSYDHDHVLVNLVDHFDEIRAQLESVAGWKTARVKRPVLILGSLDGIETGVRQLIRSRPLETNTWPIDNGKSITLPTPDEVLRIKSMLAVKRNAMRDYLDCAAIALWLNGNGGKPAEILSRIDEYYDNGKELKQEIANRFSSPVPYDLDLVALKDYKDIKPPLNDWNHITDTLGKIASEMSMRDILKNGKLEKTRAKNDAGKEKP